MKNVCVIGCGNISSVHIEAVKKCKNAVLYGICDIDKSKKETAEALGVKFFEAFDDVLLDEMVDAVHICTPHFLHFEMIKKAVEAGKKVVCEKPAVMTGTELEKLLKVNGIEEVCFIVQNRLNKSVEKLKEIIKEKALGEIKGINATLLWNRTKEYYNEAQWRGNFSTEGGGVMINQAIHTLDLLSYLAGDISSVKAHMTNFSLSDCIEVEDSCMSYLKFKSGITGVLFATNANAENDIFEVGIHFEKGIAKYCMDKLFVNGTEKCENEKATVGKSYWGMSHEKVISDFYDNNKFFGIYSIENTMKALFAMYESDRLHGEEVDVV